jgi:hypothetical protein
MFASIACAATLLLAPATAEASPPAFIGIEAIARDTLVDPARLPLIIAHQAECDLCQFVRSTPGSDFTAVAHPNGGPSRIILMRHADKPDDPDDPDLSAAGVERAEHISPPISLRHSASPIT